MISYWYWEFLDQEFLKIRKPCGMWCMDAFQTQWQNVKRSVWIQPWGQWLTVGWLTLLTWCLTPGLVVLLAFVSQTTNASPPFSQDCVPAGISTTRIVQIKGFRFLRSSGRFSKSSCPCVACSPRNCGQLEQMSIITRQGEWIVFDMTIFNDVLFTYHVMQRNTPLGWHSDDEALHGSIDEPYAILSLSMGCSRNFCIRPTNRRTDETNFMLNHGDLVSMNGLFQKMYQHRCSTSVNLQYLFSLSMTFTFSVFLQCGSRVVLELILRFVGSWTTTCVELVAVKGAWCLRGSLTYRKLWIRRWSCGTPRLVSC